MADDKIPTVPDWLLARGLHSAPRGPLQKFDHTAAVFYQSAEINCETL